jgi:hypothetical protein
MMPWFSSEEECFFWSLLLSKQKRDNLRWNVPQKATVQVGGRKRHRSVTILAMNPEERLRDVTSCSHRLIWYAAMFPQPIARDGASRACVGRDAGGAGHLLGGMVCPEGNHSRSMLQAGGLHKGNRDASTPVIVLSELPSLTPLLARSLM